MTAALVNYWYGVPAPLIGIPAMLILVYAWCTFADTRKGRR